MPEPFYFISYSPVDGEQIALSLGDQLAAGPPIIPVWLAARDLQAGIDRDEQILQALGGCGGLLYVMTTDGVHPDCECRHEWMRALKYKKPIIPLLFDRNVELPFRLEPREPIDFGQNFNAGLAHLRNHLRWRGTAKGALHTLRERLRDARRDVARAASAERLRIQEEIAELERQIAEQQQAIDNPQAAQQRTEKSIQAGLERERQPAEPVSGEVRTRFINRLPIIPPVYFQDRHVETGLIGEFLKDESQRLMTVVGRGGVGKTAMVCRLLRALEVGKLPDDGGDLLVDGIVYLSARAELPVNLPNLFYGLCKLLPDETAMQLDQLYRNPKQSAKAKMQALLATFPHGRTIVLLDNFEDAIDAETHALKERELDEALRAFLEAPPHGIKLLVTTRVPPPTLLRVQPALQRCLELDEGLKEPYAENVLKAMDADGTLGLKTAPDDLLGAARQATRGYPRALEAIVGILRTDRSTSLESLLKELQQLRPAAEDVVRDLVGEAFNRLDPLAQEVMQALAIYGVPVPAVAVDYLLQPYHVGIDSSRVLVRLANMQFVRSEAGNYYLHDVDRAYALGRVPGGQPEDWRITDKPPYSRPSLQHRGAEYFRKVRRDESAWRSVEDITPLIAEFDLLSTSGDYEGALGVLFTILPFLCRQGYYRQVERLADRLFREAEEPFRSTASGLAGWAHSALGEIPQAIEHLTAALEAPVSKTEPARVISWRLELARCYAALRNHGAAAIEYHRVLEGAQDDVETQVKALLGLGSADEAQYSYTEAEEWYRRALHVYTSQRTMKASEGGKFVLSPCTVLPDAPVTSPEAWHSMSPVINVEGQEDVKWCLFGIEKAAVQAGVAKSEEASASGKEAETSIELIPVLVKPELASIWINFAGLCARTDRLPQSEACCRLALEMYGALEDDFGVVRALDLLRSIASQVSDTDARDIIAAQEEMLKRARASSYRSLEIEILQNLSKYYLQRDKVDKAAALYSDLSRYAKELDDPSLRIQADIGLAHIEWVRGKHDTAIEKLEKLLKTGLQDLKLRSDLLLMLSRIQWDQHRPEVAVTYALAASHGYAVLRSPLEQSDAERLLASIAIDRRNYREAIRKLESALQIVRSIEIPSVTTSVLCDLARAYVWAGAREQARVAANEALKTASEIELPLTAAETLMTIGAVGSELREFEIAEWAYQQAKNAYQSIDNVYGQVAALRGFARVCGLTDRREARLSTARSAWEMARNLADPAEIRQTQMELACALSDNGRHSEAIELMKVIIADTPCDAAAIGGYGWILYQAGDYERSLEESGRALKVDPTQTWVIRNLGHAYLAKGLPDDAEREYRRAIQDRKGGENFFETILVVKRLLSQKPDLPRGNEMLKLLEDEQRKLETETEEEEVDAVTCH